MKALALVALTACGAGSTYRTTKLAPVGHTEWLFGAQVSGAGTVGLDEGGGKGGHGRPTNIHASPFPPQEGQTLQRSRESASVGSRHD